MKAMLWTRYGPPEVFELAEVEKPKPKANEILLRVHASTVTAGDGEIRRMDLAPYFAIPLRIYLGPIRPRNKILGQELSGVVEQIGSNVKGFKVGDEVIGMPGFRFGAYAEYCTLPVEDEDSFIILKPKGWSHAEATTLPFGALDALHFLSKADLQPGQSVLINGAGGSIGTYAVQIAKEYGGEVTAVDSAEKQDMLKSIGADHTINFREQDFTRLDQRYDVVFDVVGSASMAAASQVLKEGGILLNANPKLIFMLRGILARFAGKRAYFSASESKLPQLQEMLRLAEKGALKAVIDKRFPLQELAAAHRYVDTGAKAGHVVIEIVSSDK